MKRFSLSKRGVIASFWLVSLGLHGLLLLLPIAPLKSPPKEKTIKVVKLSELPASKPKLTLRPSPQTKPKVMRPAPPVVSRPAPSPSPTPPAPKPSPSAKQSPTATPVAKSEPGNVLIAYSKSAGALQSCNSPQEKCWQINETQWRLVAKNLEKEFKQQGYEFEKDDLVDDTGMGVYVVSKPGKPTQYLHFLQTNGGTIYYLDSKQLNRLQLEKVVGAQDLG